ncbi:MAG TPA: exodeoxyribonuclease VII large subunit [Polyangiales bacterium]|nr:exodeoxyribonuclease VII large subunit [Polyangiales bacterium]
MSTLPPAKRQNGDTVYRVAQLNRAVRAALEQRWSSVWVAGELSDVTRAASGHVYFTLNDELEPAQLRVVMFGNDARRSKAKLTDGARVRLLGQLSLFTPRGSYQLIARLALPQGLGDLHANFERVRAKLEAEGLLAPERKRPLPHLPRVLGVVTSTSGAALHDIVRCAQSRCPVRIVVSPCQVQGPDAPATIVAALEAVQRIRRLDVVIIGRGGGAAEDLVAFNDERVARAIAACRVPIVSAVGHEVDVSIADLVADVRAATPSNAAELVVPELRVLQGELRTAQRALERAIEVRLGRARLRLERFNQQRREPRGVLAAARGRLHALHVRLSRSELERHKRARGQLRALTERLQRSDPRLALAKDRAQLHALQARLVRAEHAQARSLRAQLRALAERLQHNDPRHLLAEQRARLHALAERLQRQDPRLLLAKHRARWLELHTSLARLVEPLLAHKRAELGRRVAQLEALSPLASLARGYAIALHEASGKALLRATDAKSGDAILLRLHDGSLRTRVESS